MSSVLIYAWRSLWRNKRRTFLTLFAITLATFCIVVVQGMMYGMVNNNIQQYTEKFIGKVQAHNPKYRDESGFYDTINPALVRELSKRAKKAGIVVVRRAYAGGLAALGEPSTGVYVVGVEPRAEKRGFTYTQNLGGNDGKGRFLQNKASKEVVLGSLAATRLGAHVGDKIVVLGSAADGSIANDTYHLVGILPKTAASLKVSFIIHRDDFADLMLARGYVHEMAFASPLTQRGSEKSSKVLEQLGGSHGGWVQTWQQLLPDLANSVKNMSGFINFIVYVFLLAVIVGVLNTMVMASRERVREFGVLQAIGTSSARILLYTSIEGALLGLIGSIMGSILSLFALSYFSHVGFDLTPFLSGKGSSLTINGIGLSGIWRGEIRLDFYTSVIPQVIILSFIASLYPAIKMTRINTVDAIHTYE